MICTLTGYTDTSLFSVVQNIDEFASKLNNDLIMIQDSVYKSKNYFICDRAKSAQEVIVSQKTKNITYPCL